MEWKMGLPGFCPAAGLRLAMVAIASLLAAAAWAQSQPKFPTPLPAPKAPASSPPSTTPAPAATPAAPAAGTPAPGGPRDPFEPLVRPARPVQPGEARKAQELDSLKLVGIVWDAKDPQMIRALVETPDGLGYYLRLNEEKFGGKVVALERDRVRFVVREQVRGAGTRERTVEIRLKPDGP